MKWFFIYLLLIPALLQAQHTHLFLVAGQSNAVGVGNADSSATYANPLCFEYYTVGNPLRPLKDPVGYTLVDEDFQAALSGSAWPAFADVFQKATGDSIIIVQAAKGGTACHAKADGGAGNWSSSYHLFSQAVTKTQKAEAYTGLQVEGIVWLQGESDAVGISQKKISACDYKTAFQDLIQRFRTQLRCNLPFYIIETGLFTPEYDPYFNAVREVQRQVAAEDPLTFIVDSSANLYRDLGWMSDVIHFNQRALDSMGTHAADKILYIANTTNLDTCYTAPQPPLSPDWAIYPSPFTDKLTVEVRNFSCGTMAITLTTLDGRKVYSNTYRCDGSLPFKFDLKTNGFKAGMYIAHLVFNNQWELTQKLVKE